MLESGKEYVSEVRAKILPAVDVVVAGGGTAGVIAALAAARNGAQTMLIEERGFVGGMLTGGNAGITMFTKYSGKTEEHVADLKCLAENPDELHVAKGIPMEITRRLLKEQFFQNGGGGGIPDACGDGVVNIPDLFLGFRIFGFHRGQRGGFRFFFLQGHDDIRGVFDFSIGKNMIQDKIDHAGFKIILLQ